MANFSPGAMFKTGRETYVGKRFTITTQAVRMPKCIFQPGLRFKCDFMRFFNPCVNSLNVIANVFLRRFVQEAELK